MLGAAAPLNDIFRKYRRCNTETGALDVERSIGEYATLLGMSYPTMHQLLTDLRRPANDAFGKLLVVFPQAGPEITRALAQEAGEKQAVA